MKRIKNSIALGAILLMLSPNVKAQTVKSPDGNVVLTFALKEGGVPTYTLDYKHKPVIKQSELGLELKRDKHASKGMNDNDLMAGFNEPVIRCLHLTKLGSPFGAKQPRFAIIITN